MFAFEAQQAREYLANGAQISLRWAGFQFIPNKAIDRNALELLQGGGKKRTYKLDEIDALLIYLGSLDIGLETIGEIEDNGN